jgi:hypothetical protein
MSFQFWMFTLYWNRDSGNEHSEPAPHGPRAESSGRSDYSVICHWSWEDYLIMPKWAAAHWEDIRVPWVSSKPEESVPLFQWPPRNLVIRRWERQPAKSVLLVLICTHLYSDVSPNYGEERELTVKLSQETSVPSLSVEKGSNNALS